MPIQLPQRPISPKGSEKATLELNLDARKSAPTVAFDVTNLASYNDTTSMAVYDQLGGAHTLSYYFVKSATPAGTAASSWDIYATLDGATLGGGTSVGQLSFDANGLATAGTATSITVPTNGVVAGTSSFASDVKLDLTNTTQFGASFQVNNLNQDGYQAAAFSSFTVEADGKVTARYANGQSQPLAKVGLFNFRNPEALQPIGANGWLRTDAAGPEFTPSTDQGSFGKIQSGALEGANLDLTGELVNMITAQRVYQANAQTIKTQDSVLQTLVNLR
jgi:flagellar hook protein FlgE